MARSNTGSTPCNGVASSCFFFDPPRFPGSDFLIPSVLVIWPLQLIASTDRCFRNTCQDGQHNSRGALYGFFPRRWYIMDKKSHEDWIRQGCLLNALIVSCLLRLGDVDGVCIVARYLLVLTDNLRRPGPRR